nr:retrovirus-related Pol polyprotein from transposon TNT 1-94 [Tanacetum cinerariifolium]
MVPAAVLTQSKPVPITAVRPVSTAVSKIKVTRPRHAKPIVTKTNSPTRRNLTRSPSPKGNPQHALKDKGVIDSGCSRHMIGNMFYLSNFKELNGGYVTFKGNPKGGNMFYLSDFKELNGGYVTFRGNPKGGKFDGKVDEGFLVGYSISSKAFKPEFDEKKPKSEVNISPSNITQSRKQDDKTKREAKGKSPVESFTRYKNLSVDFKDYSDNSINEVNAAGTLVPTVGQISPNSTNTFSVVGLSNVAASPTHGGMKGIKREFSGNPQHALKDKGVIESGCSRHMTGNISYLFDFEEINRGYVAFGGNPKGGKIRGNSVYLEPLSKMALLKGKNRTIIEAARTMLADSLLPILFWSEAVNTACYVQNRVLVTKPYNKIPYELLPGRTPSIGFMRPFGCLVTILNTLDSLGKFNGKVDKGFLVGYFVNSKAFRVFNSRTRIVQETLHANFLENKPNVVGSGSTWLFDIDSLTRTMNYQPVTTRNQTNHSTGFQDKFDAEKAEEESDQQYVTFPVWSSGFTNPQNTDGDAAFDGKKPKFDEKKYESEVNVFPSSSAQSRKQDDKTKKEAKGKIPTVGQISPNSTNTFSVAGPSNAAASPTHGKSSSIDASQLPDDPHMLELEDITYSNDKDDVELKDITYSSDEDDVGAEANFNNLETSMTVSPIPTTRVNKDHPMIEIIGDLSSAIQTRSMTRVAKDQ